MIDGDSLEGSFLNEDDVELRRVIIASTVSAIIAWYDFDLYGIATALAFGKVFFPESSAVVGVLEAFSVFFIGFLGRPIGAAIFGHWGDRIGRKATLIITLPVLGVATVLVGCLPGYNSIGIWAPILLTFIRLVQGIGVGGEWAGSVLLAIERPRVRKNRGFISAWTQFASPAGLFLAFCAVLFSSWLSGDQFIVWGWRIPFLLSAVILPIGLWIRRGVGETPVFQRIRDEQRIARVPVLEVLMRQPKLVALCALLRLPEQAPGYIMGTWILSYGVTALGMSRDFLLLSVTTQTVLAFGWVLVAGHLSDIFGRKKVFIIGCLLTGVFGFVYFAMLNSKSASLIFLAITFSMLPIMTQYGPQAALIAENYAPRLRYSGTSLGYQLASTIAGGPAPFVATWLFATYHSAWPIAIYIAGCACIGVGSAALLPNNTGRDFMEEHSELET